MDNPPLVTIAIPAYKTRFLKQAIQSAINQTYKNVEIVIVNDASPEDVGEIVSSFEDKRIRYYVNEKNIGGQDPAENWNKCLEYANGEFFSLLCDDDFYENFFIEEMIELWKSYPKVSVFRSRVKMVDSDNNIIDLYPSSPSWESAMDYLWAKVSRNRIQTISEFMLKTSVMKEVGGYKNMPKAWCADEMSILTFAQKGGVAHSNRLAVSFRMSGDNISSSKGKYVIDKIRAQIIYSDWIRGFIKEEPSWFKKCIDNHRNCSLSACIPEYLANAPMKDILFLLTHMKEYSFPLYFYGKAFIIRISQLLK